MRGTHCVHYVGVGCPEVCKAGVNYAELNGGTIKAMFLRLPCFTRNHPTEIACEHFRAPTEEELAAREARRKRMMANAIAGIQVSEPFRKANKGRSAQETVVCPVCQGRLHLSIAASNGHVHGRCETEDCVAWME